VLKQLAAGRLRRDTCEVLPFDQLTAIGRARRLRELAHAVASEDYQFNVTNIRLVSAHSFNTIFRIDSPAGRFAMRVGDACRIHAPGVEDTEAAWLDQLADSAIAHHRNVPTPNGKRWVNREHPGVPTARVCTLFSWLDGRELRDSATPDSVRAAGRLLAQLHEHANGSVLAVPHELHARHAVYFGSEDRIGQLNSEHRNLLRDAVARVQAVVDHLWDDEPRHLLHGDFGPHNLMTWRNQLRPIDFQDLLYGPAALDLGITLADLARTDPSFVQPFEEGYMQIRNLPEPSPYQLETLAIGRSLNIMNLALLAPDSGIARGYESHQRRVVDWMMR